MFFTAMMIAVLAAIAVWWLLIQRLREKPWLTQGIVPTSQDGSTAAAPKVGLWVFLAVVSSLFGLFSSAYVLRMQSHGGLVAWQRLDEPGILWVNTLVLVLASAALQIARNRIDKDQLEHARAHFAAGGLLTVLFLVGQVMAWRLANPNGTLGASDPAYSLFVLLTALHGLHLVGGLLVLGRTATHLFGPVATAGAVARGRIRLSVQLCTTYWHWLLLIWLGLFALLLST
jgi:cytochrome c oxidase subunit 3